MWELYSRRPGEAYNLITTVCGSSYSGRPSEAYNLITTLLLDSQFLGAHLREAQALSGCKMGTVWSRRPVKTYYLTIEKIFRFT
ncbi:hypothetical protein PO909_023462, partial [Leuciscus waleckii]